MITSCHNCVLHHGSCHLLSAYQRIYRMAERKCKARQMQLAMQENGHRTQPGLPNMMSAFRPVLNTWESCQAAAQLRCLPSKMHSTGHTSLKARCLRCGSSRSALVSDMLCGMFRAVLCSML